MATRIFDKQDIPSLIEAAKKTEHHLFCDTDDEKQYIAEQRAKIGDYRNPENGCPNCGRYRVMIGDDGNHRCEKCAWCVEDHEIDRQFSDYLFRGY